MAKISTALFLFIATSFSAFGQNDNQLPSPVQVLPIIISSLALVVSVISLFFNYYIQYRKKAAISIVLSDKLKCWLGDKKFICINSITVFNKGAQYGAVYKMTAELFHKQSDEVTRLQWNMFVQDKNIGTLGEKFKTHTAFESWAETVIIQGRTATTKKIQFKSIEDFLLREGDYELEISVFTGTAKNASYSTTKRFKVNQVNLNKWEEVATGFDTENQIAKKALTFQLND